MPSRLLQLLPAGTTLAGRDLHPLKNRAFPRHTAPEPHDFSVRNTAARLARRFRSRLASPCNHLRTRRRRVHHSPPRVRDDRDTPLAVGRDATEIAYILKNGSIIFFAWGLDRNSAVRAICPSGTLACSCKRRRVRFHRHCERSEAIQTFFRAKNWIASLRSQ